MRRLLPCVALLFLLSFTTTARSEDEALQAKVYENAQGETLRYRVHVPQKLDPKQKLPVVLFLHGAGERGSDNGRQLVHGVNGILAFAKKQNQPLILIAPQCPNNEQWVDVPWSADAHTMPKQPSASMKLVLELLQETFQTLPADKDRLYVTGLSMGGYGTWDLVQRHPELVAAAVPVCGGGDSQLAGKIKDVPVWAFHGDKDGVVKPIRSRAMIEGMRRAGGEPRYTEYPGVGHNSWTATYKNEDMLKWLFEQSLSKRSTKSAGEK